MCVVCGCSDTSPSSAGGPGPHAHDHGHTHDHDHAHPHAHDPGHTHATGHAHSHVQVDPTHGDLHFGAGAARVSVPGLSQARTVKLEVDILGENQRLADHNRQHFAAHGVTALNLVSSPGSGKTTLLCATIEALRAAQPQLPVAVIEGDQQTSFDADRIRATGAPAVQVNTGKGCHLDAPMVAEAFAQLHSHDHHPHHGDHGDHDDTSLLFIENVGNLVCPALWDLGEAAKVAILSVTEGEDKPLKYPDMFAASELMLLNKIDLLPHLQFDVARCIAAARQVNPAIEVIQLSASTGEGMDAWLVWLNRRLHPAAHGAATGSVNNSNDSALQQRIAELEAQLAQARAALTDAQVAPAHGH